MIYILTMALSEYLKKILKVRDVILDLNTIVNGPGGI